MVFWCFLYVYQRVSSNHRQLHGEPLGSANQQLGAPAIFTAIGIRSTNQLLVGSQGSVSPGSAQGKPLKNGRFHMISWDFIGLMVVWLDFWWWNGYEKCLPILYVARSILGMVFQSGKKKNRIWQQSPWGGLNVLPSIWHRTSPIIDFSYKISTVMFALITHYLSQFLEPFFYLVYMLWSNQQKPKKLHPPIVNSGLHSHRCSIYVSSPTSRVDSAAGPWALVSPPSCHCSCARRKCLSRSRTYRQFLTAPSTRTYIYVMANLWLICLRFLYC